MERHHSSRATRALVTAMILSLVTPSLSIEAFASGDQRSPRAMGMVPDSPQDIERARKAQGKGPLPKTELGRLREKKLKESRARGEEDSAAIEAADEELFGARSQTLKGARRTKPAPSPSPTYSPYPSPTPLVTSSPTPVPTVTSSPTPVPTVTSSPTPVPTATSSPSPVSSAIDNSLLPIMPAIGNQGSIGSCVAWAISTSYSFNFAAARKLSSSVRFAPRHIYNMGGLSPSAGMSIITGLNMVNKTGVISESEFPYMYSDGTGYRFNEYPTGRTLMEDALKKRATSYRMYKMTTEMVKVKEALQNGLVGVFGMTITDGTYNAPFVISDNPNSAEDDRYIGHRAGGAYTGATYAPHAMAIVGYNDSIHVDLNRDGVRQSNEIGAFKIANSWGTAWGTQGYMWLSYSVMAAEVYEVYFPIAGAVDAMPSHILEVALPGGPGTPVTVSRLHRNGTWVSGISAQTGSKIFVFPRATDERVHPLPIDGVSGSTVIHFDMRDGSSFPYPSVRYKGPTGVTLTDTTTDLFQDTSGVSWDRYGLTF